MNAAPGYRWAALRGTSDDFELDLDPRPLARTEVLVETIAIDRLAGPMAGRLTTSPLVAQPIGQAWWDPLDVDFTAVETVLDVTNPAGEQVAVRTKSALQVWRDGVRILSFSLLPEQPADRNDDRGAQGLGPAPIGRRAATCRSGTPASPRSSAPCSRGARCGRRR